MKAARVNPQGQLELTDVPIPRIGPRDVLVKMKVCGICGTDLEKLHGVRVTPPILGHEVAGDVEEVGSEVHGYSKGDRVTVHHHVPCMTCIYCKRGDHTMCADFPKSNLDPCGFAEYFRVPETNVRKGAVFHLPTDMSYEEAALSEPTGCCIRALRKLAVLPGDDFVVIGTGPAGLTHVQLLRSMGAEKIFATDLVESRLEWARRFGADAAFNAAAVNAQDSILGATNGKGVDKVIVSSASKKAIESSLRLARKGGKILLFGIPPEGTYVNLDTSYVFIREISLIPSYSTTETEIEAALQMMTSKTIHLSEMITHKFHLADIAEAFRTAEDTESSLKVMVHG